MRAAILSIGDELTGGLTVDANASWLAGELESRSIEVVQMRVVPDDRGAIAIAFGELAAGADLLVATGGLGPTADDLTRHALGDAVAPGAALEPDPQAVKHLARCFRGRAMPPSNHVQTLRPPGARMIANARGTAMGLAARLGPCEIFVLPGPPGEMRPMFTTEVAPGLPAGAGDVTRYGEVHAYGLGESAAGERLGDLCARERSPRVGLTHAGSVVTARIRARGPAGVAQGALDGARAAIFERWTPWAYGHDGQTLAAAAAGLLAGRTLAVAESCTGGWLGKLIVDEPGASDFFAGGWITYSDALKRACLGVPDAMLQEHGAVSAPVAAAMAERALDAAATDEALAITGIAGPSGGTAAKRVGTVFIAHASRDDSGRRSSVRRFRFPGDRTVVRDRSAKSALQLLRFALMGVGPEVKLLWET